MKCALRICAAVLVLTFAGAGCGDGNKTDEDATDTVGEDGADVAPDTPTPCTSDEDCDNGLYCDGEETCGTDGTCQPGTDVECEDDDPCTMDSCDEESLGCVFDPMDADGDGYIAIEVEGTDCGGTDCDDSQGDFHPDADEDECDLLDKDCDDDDSEYIDDDGDGWIDEACDAVMSDHTGYEGFGDCDDDGTTTGEDPENIYPGAPEGCDATIDHDCDGDETEIDTDHDGDDFPPLSCDGDDCDDDDDTVYPGAPEVCDMTDHDCDGSLLDGPGIDDDGDTVPDEACGGTDCDDTDGDVHGAYTPPTDITDSPVSAADEDAFTCDLVDHDCDGDLLDHAEADNDSDTVLDEVCGGTDCDDGDDTVYPGATRDCGDDHDCDTILDDDSDEDGYVWDACPMGDDCDDDDPAYNPGITPTCTSTDFNCNGNPDQDDDGDSHLRETCTGGDDCDDDDATTYPGATLSCDLEDHDCNSNPDRDNDADGYVRVGCSTGTDCDDTDSGIYPGATVTCVAEDRDCNGNDDNDQDGDGHVRGAVVLGWPVCSGGDDCDDDDATRYPGYVSPPCDLVDNDCTGTWTDESGADDDGDGYLDDSCTGGDDCDDLDDRFHPAPPPDVCTALDYDCDTTPDTLDSPAASTVMGPTVSRGDVAWSGSQFGVAWSKIGTSTYDIFFQRLDVDGTVIGGSEVVVHSSTWSSQRPRIAWGGGRWGIVHEEGGSNAILYTLAADGTDKQPPTGRILTDGSCSFNGEYPDIAYDGTGFGMTWHCDGHRILFGVTDTTGGFLTSTNINAGASGDVIYPAIAWNTSRYGVVWSHMVGSNYEIEFDLVDPITMSHGSEVQLSSANPHHATLAAISAGSVDISGVTDGFGIVWQVNEVVSPYPQLIYGAVGSTAGATSSEALIAGASRDSATIAWNGSEFGIAVHNISAPSDIDFMRMADDGSAAGSILRIDETTDADTSPRLVWQTGRFGAIWTRSGSGVFDFLWCTY